MLNNSQIVLEDDSHYVQCTDTLSPVIEELLNETTNCTPGYLVTECKCGRKLIVSGCERLICKTCEKHNTQHRADRVMQRVIKSGHQCGIKIHYPKMIYTIFTIPMHLRYKYYDRKVLTELIKQIWNVLKYNFDAKWCMVAVHPISEKNPTVFHPHINILWLQGSIGAEYIDVEELKAQYGVLLDYEGLPDVRTRYSNKAGQLYHWCSYIVRVFPEFSRWLGNIRYYGKPPKLDAKGECICHVCLCHLNVLGYLTDEGVQLFVKSDGIDATGPPAEISSYYINFFVDL